MTPGATIADTRDSGVFFYNPALLAIRPKTTLEFSGSLYQVDYTRMVNAVGAGRDLRSLSGGVSPQIHSGSFRWKNHERLVMAYALLHNHIINDRITQRQDVRINVLDDSYSPGAETYIGQFSEINQVSEIAGVFSLGYKMGRDFYAGLSLEAPVRQHLFDIAYSGRALQNPVDGDPALFPPVSNVESAYRLNYIQVNLRPKIGIAYNVFRHHWGLLITLPQVRIFSNGTLMSDNVIADLRLTPDTDPINLLANTRQRKLPVREKSPLSFALGYSFDYGKGQIYVAAEYFAPLKKYPVLTPRNEYFIRPDTGSANTSTPGLLKFRDDRRGVFNLAGGVTFPVRPSVQGYVSVRTDFSYARREVDEEEAGYLVYRTNWNLYHGQFGVNIQKDKQSFRAGLLLTYGGDNRYRPEVNFDTPSEPNLLLGNPVDVRVRHVAAGLLLSYIHNL